MGEWGRYGKSRTWHAVRTFTRVPGRAVSMCSRTLHSPYEKEPPKPYQPRCKICSKALKKAGTAE
jgi:hypothetical protein